MVLYRRSPFYSNDLFQRRFMFFLILFLLIIINLRPIRETMSIIFATSVKSAETTARIVVICQLQRFIDANFGKFRYSFAQSLVEYHHFSLNVSLKSCI